MKTKALIWALLCFAFALLPACESNEDIALKKAISSGKMLYQKHNCGNCHGVDGKGNGRLYPPIAGADYLSQNPDKLACIIKYGMKGKIMVNGQEYDGLMPGVVLMDEIDLSYLLTYLHNFGEQKGNLVTKQYVLDCLAKCDTSARLSN